MTLDSGKELAPPRFTLTDAERAHDEWGCNCGPASLAAIMGLTLDEVRWNMGDFESKRYTNPTLMWSALDNVGAKWTKITIPPNTWAMKIGWPVYGLVRIQWEGPWSQPGMNPRWRYRFTHWVGAARNDNGGTGIFDINCINNGSGWVSLREWGDIAVPYILQGVPRADGKWHLTHTVEVAR
jgi:hypothetical protein